jgi:two-component system LytT family sensor kinase
MLEAGVINVQATIDGDDLMLNVTDNAGLYQPSNNTDGLGMNLVHKRIQNLFGSQYGIEVECKADEFTRVSVRVPLKEIDQ